MRGDGQGVKLEPPSELNQKEGRTELGTREERHPLAPTRWVHRPKVQSCCSSDSPGSFQDVLVF